MQLTLGQHLAHLSRDDALVLALRYRDGRPNEVPGHRSTGACKYAERYPTGGCDWCAAADVREAFDAPAEPKPNVIMLPQRWQSANDEDPALRIA